MSVAYKLYQDKRPNLKTHDKWYARAVHIGTIDTNEIATIMQANCTLKRSDILAVLAELTEVMRIQLQNSLRVKLNGLGTFKIGLKTAPAEKVVDFSVAKNIKGLHVLFQPEVHIDAKRNRTNVLLNGARVREASVYEVKREKESDLEDKGLEESNAEEKPSNSIPVPSEAVSSVAPASVASVGEKPQTEGSSPTFVEKELF